MASKMKQLTEGKENHVRAPWLQSWLELGYKNRSNFLKFGENR
jgi:hypothetical protein